MGLHPSSDATALAFELQQQEVAMKQHEQLHFVWAFTTKAH